MTLTRFPIKDFRGGLNTRDSPFELSPNESPDLQDVTVSSLVGQLETRKGKEKINVTAMVGFPAQHMKQVVIGANKRFLMYSAFGNVFAMEADGKIKELNGGTEGTVWQFEVFSDAAFKDWVYMSNGVDQPKKWDGIAAKSVVWPITIGALPDGAAIKVWENRMFITGVAAAPQRIYFSEFGDPEGTLKEYGFVDVRSSEDDLDSVQDLAVLGSKLIVLKRRSIYYISSAVTMANRRIGSPGVWGRFMCAELEDKLYFLNPQGIFSTGGVQVSMESGSINNYFPEHFSPINFSNARMIATRDTYPRLLLAFTSKTSTTSENDRIIEMVPHINFRRIGGRRYLLLPAFFIHTLSATSISTWNTDGNEEKIVGSSFSATAFDTLPLLDTFNRAEEDPLSNGAKWTKWAWATTAGKIIKTIGAVGQHLTGKVVEQLEGARWNVAEVTNPAVVVDCYSGMPDKEVNIHTCFQAAAQSGYTLSVSSALAKAELISWNAGVPTVLATSEFNPTGLNVKLALTVGEGGAIAGWIKQEEGVWTRFIFVQDFGWTKGYSGLSWRHDLNAQGFRNFRVGTANTAPVISRLFHGPNDEGVFISGYWHSAWFSLQGEEPKERIRRINVDMSGDMVISVYKDFEAVPTFSATMPKAVGGGESYRLSRVRPETWGRFHSIKLAATATGSAFLINGCELVYRGGKEH